jgi:alanine racemase
VGYADGYNRLLSNGFEAIVGKRKVPVAGNVCMDWIMLDVTEVPDVAVHDDVTLLGCEEEVCVFAEDWAERIGSISYEVFCQVSKRVPRVYLAGSALGHATAVSAASTTLEFRGSHV